MKVTQWIKEEEEGNQTSVMWQKNYCGEQITLQSEQANGSVPRPACLLQLRAIVYRCWGREAFVLCAQNGTSSITGKMDNQLSQLLAIWS